MKNIRPECDVISKCLVHLFSEKKKNRFHAKKGVLSVYPNHSYRRFWIDKADYDYDYDYETILVCPKTCLF